MKTLKIFIASSAELRNDRDDFRIFISKENDRLHSKGLYLKVVQWENFLDSISDSRLQDEYNEAIRECDIVVCLFFTKVGKYSAEEFDTAYQVFKDEGKPQIWTYFKNAQITTGSITSEINTLLAFKKKIGDLGHFYTEYTNIDNLINQYRTQLDKFLPKFESDQPMSAARSAASSSSDKNAIGQGHKYNSILTEELLNAIVDSNPKAKNFVRMNSNWTERKDLLSTAKRIIISGFTGIVGIQLRKLFSIGEEKDTYDKLQRYLENTHRTAKRSLQLVTFSLISVLWDQKENENFEFDAEVQNKLALFFQKVTEESLSGFADLIRTLVPVFANLELDIPFPTLTELVSDEKSWEAFNNDCSYLDEINTKILSSDIGHDDCLKYETNLASLLKHFGFLTEYKMISMKEVGYAKQRIDKDGDYFHNYALLEGDNQANNSNVKRVRKEKSPVISLAVLLCKRNLLDNINLSPFIIDYNALGLKGGSRICVFSFSNSYDDNSINYSFVEDNSKVSLKRSSNPKPDDENKRALNLWLANENNRRDLNYDRIFDIFQQAKKTLADLEEDMTLDAF